ncbi:fimbrial protein [Pantoea sp. M_9]|uniref:fimbrial protein n=1 Tax=Pantoea sp. M_9 TaxID=2608041 RepID=UPI001231ACD1|nr:fimbrial protein [Pantoea sp. M_9]KAA5971611.1 fimbrial protein [Pantoea sp. M_9]
MKRTILAMTTVASLFSGAAFAVDGTINFTGKITDDTCDIDAGSATQNINMGTIGSDAFQGPGTIAGATGFKIVMTNCPASHSAVSVKFDGAPDNGNPDILALSSSPTNASGVGIQLRDYDRTPISLNTDSKPVPVTGGTATMNFSAAYIATAATVTAGDADSTVNFTVNYN